VKYNHTIHQRRTIRLPGYNYAQPGEYFVTICTRNKEHSLGEILRGDIELSQAGEIVRNCWREIPAHFPHVDLDAYVLMPNHIHGILVFNSFVGIQNSESLRNTYQHIIPQSLGSVIRSFKGAVKRECSKRSIDFVWQHNYFEHVIRDEKDLARIRAYIDNNPSEWLGSNENQGYLPGIPG
jgi:putative transposase